jgi:hypothetical protein
MKRTHLLGLLAIFAGFAVLVGCSTPSTPTPDYVGTWSGPSPISSGDTWTITVTATTMTIVETGTFAPGQVSLSNVVDESAKHMTTNVSGGSGSLPTYFTSTIYYWTYLVTGSTISFVVVQVLPFSPTATGTGSDTFTKQ